MNRLTRILIELALQEDLDHRGDLTSEYFVDQAHRSTGKIISRESAVISGSGVASEVCRAVDPNLDYEVTVPDGSSVDPGDLVGIIRGKTRSVLTAERTVLNFMQRLSGIATVTRAYQRRIEHTQAILLDTRKTTPGLRELEKAAVVDGGGTNHRFGLYDAIMVKDNHLSANPEVPDLASRVKQVKLENADIKVEVETDTLDQVAAFLPISEIDVILLDNMTNEQLSAAVKMRDELGGATRLEASGGVNLDTVAGIAETGVDFISVGALTHSVRSIDLGLDLAVEA